MADKPGWTMWDTRFNREDYLFGKAPARFVERFQHHIPRGVSVLCVAEGEGRNAVHLARQGLKVSAFDASARGLQKAQALANDAGVSVDFQLSGVEEWDWKQAQYDAVVAVFIQFAPPDMRVDIFAGLDAALVPGGTLLLHGFAPRQVDYGTGGPSAAENMYTLDMLGEAFVGYEVLHQKDYDEVVDAGPGHNGLAAMVDFVARKSG